MGIRVGKKLWGNAEGSYMYHCPGCGMLHCLHVEKPSPHTGAAWGFNRNGDAPTFTPSVLVQWDKLVGDGPLESRQRVPQVCHSFVTDGRIAYLEDCTHDMRGMTVEMPDWED